MEMVVDIPYARKNIWEISQIISIDLAMRSVIEKEDFLPLYDASHISLNGLDDILLSANRALQNWNL
jgi:hypothetical protein